MYSAIVAKIDSINQIEGANTIAQAFVLGSSIIVSKDTDVGDVGIFFPEEGQLSHEYCSHNNLYRDPEKNEDKDKTGYFEDNRRVRTQKFMKVRSEGVFMPLKSIEFLGVDISKLKEGDKLHTINDHVLCQKYISPRTIRAMRDGKKKVAKIEAPTFFQHVDTEQFNYCIKEIKPGSLITISQKVHGTSARYGYCLVKRPPEGLKHRINNFLMRGFGFEVFGYSKPEYEYICGTRRVNLFEDKRGLEDYHGTNAYRFKFLDQLKPYLEKGMTVYGEIYGWANGSPIMPPHDLSKVKDKKYEKKYGKNSVYAYGLPEGECDFLIYRIVESCEDGSIIDYTPFQLKDWCEKRGFKSPEVLEQFIFDGDYEKLAEVVNKHVEGSDVMGEDWTDSRHLREGVVVRVDHSNKVPMFLKSKNFYFKVCEGIAKEENVDIEDAS